MPTLSGRDHIAGKCLHTSALKAPRVHIDVPGHMLLACKSTGTKYLGRTGRLAVAARVFMSMCCHNSAAAALRAETDGPMPKSCAAHSHRYPTAVAASICGSTPVWHLATVEHQSWPSSFRQGSCAHWPHADSCCWLPTTLQDVAESEGGLQLGAKSCLRDNQTWPLVCLHSRHSLLLRLLLQMLPADSL